jgi:hypothetical protein
MKIMPSSLSSLLCFSSLQKASLRPGSDGVVRKGASAVKRITTRALIVFQQEKAAYWALTNSDCGILFFFSAISHSAFRI